MNIFLKGRSWGLFQFIVPVIQFEMRFVWFHEGNQAHFSPCLSLLRTNVWFDLPTKYMKCPPARRFKLQWSEKEKKSYCNAIRNHLDPLRFL